MSKWRLVRMVAYGFLAGTAGLDVLKSKDAKMAYTHITAAVMRGKDCVMKKATTLKENCEDIAADAKEINEKRYAEEAAKEIEDARALLECAEAAEKETKAAPAGAE